MGVGLERGGARPGPLGDCPALVSSSRGSFTTARAPTPGTSPLRPSAGLRTTAGCDASTTSTTWARWARLGAGVGVGMVGKAGVWGGGRDGGQA